MKLRTATKTQLTKCWIYDEGKFILTAKGGKAIERKLPYVDAKYADALKENGIPFELVEMPNRRDPEKVYTACAYWSPDMYEKEEVRLPVYTRMQGTDEKYVYTGETHSEKVITCGTLKESSKIKERVRYICTKQDLDGKMGMVKHIAIDQKEIDMKGEDGDIKLLQAYNAEGKPTKVYGVFDMEQVKNNLFIQVVAPEGTLRAIAIGKGGKNKENWENLLGGGKKIVFI